MPDIKVRRTGISAQEVSSALKDALGEGYEVTQTDNRRVDIRKNYFVRANVGMQEEPGGTLFQVQGSAVPPLYGLSKLLNSQGIAKRIAAAIGTREEFRDNG
jgi:hypothetical protein